MVKTKLHLLFTLVKSSSGPFGVQTSDGDCDRSGLPFRFSSVTGKSVGKNTERGGESVF